MGDGGSMMLGFLLGTLATSSAAIGPGQRLGTTIAIIVPFLPFGIPIFEVAMSIFRRWIKGQPLFLGDGNHLHHRLIAKIRKPGLTVGIFYAFSAALCALSLLLVFEKQSGGLKTLGAVITLLLLIAAIASIKLYQIENLVTTLRNRPHFRFLTGFGRFMRSRMARAESFGEYVSLLESGVRDLGFDTVEVERDGRMMDRWENPRVVHPENPRIHSEETFQEFQVSVKWTRPLHFDPSYDEYLMLTWYRFLVKFREGMRRHSVDLSRTDKTNVLSLRKHSTR
jgi:UDP-GlcNAc:undecaprenyl-phosphate GlcNAc-1-phosphate transferase